VREVKWVCRTGSCRYQYRCKLHYLCVSAPRHSIMPELTIDDRCKTYVKRDWYGKKINEDGTVKTNIGIV